MAMKTQDVDALSQWTALKQHREEHLFFCVFSSIIFIPL